MILVKTFALAGGAMVTAFGVLAAAAAGTDGARDSELGADVEDESGDDEAGGYGHDDTLTRLTRLPALVTA
jgi:hypothetical protein